MTSYPGRWSVVSGSVERGESPRAAALREVTEECGYPASALRVVAADPPFVVEEDARRVRWRVHSFLCLLCDGAEPRLNSENAEWEWVAPSRLGDFQTVPSLGEALGRLLPPPGRAAAEAAAELAGNTRDGAHRIAHRMIQLLRDVLPTVTDWPSLLAVAGALADAQPSMASPGAVLWRWLQDAGLSGFDPSTAGRRPRRPGASGMGSSGSAASPSAAVRAPLRPVERGELDDRLGEIATALEGAARETARRGALRLAGRETVATFSRSETVRETFDLVRGCPDAPRRVLLGRSLPGGEGEVLARELEAMGYVVGLLTDEELRVRLRETSLLLVGADAVLADGSVINKVGTRALAVSARAVGVPTVVLADSFKRCAPSRGLTIGPGPDGGPPWFERVEAGWVDEILDEGDGR